MLVDGTPIGPESWIVEVDGDDESRVKLSRLRAGDQFTYEFAFGDGWTHLCTVEPDKIDPLDTLGIVPDHPLPFWGGGDIPDQYGRRWLDHDGEAPVPPNPGVTDLPPLQQHWGPRSLA